MKKLLAALLTVTILISLLSSCSGSNIVRTKKISSALTQTTVIKKSMVANTTDYNDFLKAFKSSFTVPGLLEGIIPQGICLDQTDHLLIIRGYYDDKAFPTQLMLLDASSGKFLKTVGLKDLNGKAFHGHAGGLACSGSQIYVTLDNKTLVISTKKVVDAANGSDVQFDSTFKLNTQGAFANISNGVLWVGDFVVNSADAHKKAKHITTLKNGETFYAYCEGYKLENGLPKTASITTDKSGYVPDYILAIPDEVQGMAVASNGDMIFSASNGRKTKSKLYKFSNLLKNEPVSQTKIDGKTVSVYAAESHTKQAELAAPPLSQSIVYDGNDLLLLFESGASKFRSHGGVCPVDTLYRGSF